ncbi:DUF6094 domain-containing protein, partial [Brevibacillus daliensis]|uniref:DUF6094 domain-containing protein n=1 Tax=Brevibacillus daliensis TaxID=2892995 RepID=UPI001E53A10B
MARLASQSLGGFYSTPPEMVQLVCKKLKVDEGSFINILDTCAGEGEALKMFQDHLEDQRAKVVTYGNELEKSRFDKAATCLDHVIHGGYERLRTSPFHSFWWGNPPYDHGSTERMEVSAFRLHSYRNEKQMIQKGAVVCYCVPQESLKDLAELLAYRLDDIRVYRFTDEFYPRFHQVVVFGYFATPSEEKARKLKEYLKEVGSYGPESLETLEKEDHIYYEIPAAQNKIEFFRGDALKTSLVYPHQFMYSQD